MPITLPAVTGVEEARLLACGLAGYSKVDAEEAEADHLLLLACLVAMADACQKTGRMCSVSNGIQLRSICILLMYSLYPVCRQSMKVCGLSGPHPP